MKSEEPRWEKVLRERRLSRSQETWYRRTIQWFLGYCRKQRPSLSPNRTVQELMGHESVETTQIYLHVMQKPGLGVKSPLDG